MTVRALFAATLALASLNVVALPAQAAETQQRTVLVRYNDLDLSTDAGAATLSGRIAAAADRACAPVDHRDLSQMASFRDCRDAAIAAATPKLQAVVAAARGGSQYAMAPKVQAPLH